MYWLIAGFLLIINIFDVMDLFKIPIAEQAIRKVKETIVRILEA